MNTVERSARPPVVVCSTSRPVKGKSIVESGARVKALPAPVGPKLVWAKKASNCRELRAMPTCEG